MINGFICACMFVCGIMLNIYCSISKAALSVSPKAMLIFIFLLKPLGLPVFAYVCVCVGIFFVACCNNYCNNYNITFDS